LVGIGVSLSTEIQRELKEKGIGVLCFGDASLVVDKAAAYGYDGRLIFPYSYLDTGIGFQPDIGVLSRKITGMEEKVRDIRRLLPGLSDDEIMTVAVVSANIQHLSVRSRFMMAGMMHSFSISSIMLSVAGGQVEVGTSILTMGPRIVDIPRGPFPFARVYIPCWKLKMDNEEKLREVAKCLGPNVRATADGVVLGVERYYVVDPAGGRVSVGKILDVAEHEARDRLDDIIGIREIRGDEGKAGFYIAETCPVTVPSSVTLSLMHTNDGTEFIQFPSTVVDPGFGGGGRGLPVRLEYVSDQPDRLREIEALVFGKTSKP